MHYFKTKTKLTIIILTIITLTLTLCLSTLAKTEVYFSLYNNSQILSTTSPKPEVQTLNINITSQDELIKILKISGPLAQKIIALREEPGGFKDLQDLTKLPEITNLEWKEWKEDRITITVN